MWDKNSIQALLAQNDRAVFRAVAAIYARQTDSEKNAETTTDSNGIGFSYADARLGSYYADYLARNGRLTGTHLERARRMMMKYWRQLAEIANAKQTVAVESVAQKAQQDDELEELEQLNEEALHRLINNDEQDRAWADWR